MTTFQSIYPHIFFSNLWDADRLYCPYHLAILFIFSHRRFGHLGDLYHLYLLYVHPGRLQTHDHHFYPVGHPDRLLFVTRNCAYGLRILNFDSRVSPWKVAFQQRSWELEHRIYLSRPYLLEKLELVVDGPLASD